MAAAIKLGFKNIGDVDPQQLMDLIKRHIAFSNKDATAIVSLTGETVTIDADNNKVNGPFNSANILEGPLPGASCAGDVVVYSIDSALMPEQYADVAAPPAAAAASEEDALRTVESSSVIGAAAGSGLAIVVAAFV